MLDCPPADAALVARLRAEIEARDGEIAALRARATADAASLERRAEERGAAVEVARRVLGAGFDPGGLGLDAIRRAVLAAALGAVAALRAEPRPMSRGADPLAGQLAAGGGPHPSAREARDAYLAGAWKPDPTQGAR